MQQVLLAGGTGLVGGTFLKRNTRDTLRIIAVGRRAPDGADDAIITDFLAPPVLPTAQAALCALGTTIAAAGSRGAFRAVDQDAVLTFAAAARDAGVEHFILVSAVGASPQASVFYSRVKGETEAGLEAMGFSRLDILQPGLLLGSRREYRPVEALLQRIDPLARLAMRGPLGRYAGIDAGVVAAAMHALLTQDTAGTFRHDNLAMHRLAESVA